MGLRGRKSVLREAMKSLLLQHKYTGIEFAIIEQRFCAVDRCRLLKLLENLRHSGEAYSERATGGRSGLWFPSSANPDHEGVGISSTDWRRIQLARQADQSNPIVFYGSGLKGGRCASVWEYAQHMRSSAGARA